MHFQQRTRLPLAFSLLVFVFFQLDVFSPRASCWAQSRDEILIQTGQAAPDGNGTISFLGSHVLSDAGQVTFRAGLNGTAGGSSDDSGVFRSTDNLLIQIAREGQSAPGGDGTFDNFLNPVINGSGQVAFFGILKDTDNPVGIFRGSGGEIAQLARSGQAAPDGNGTFGNFSEPTLSDSGQVSFFGILTGTNGGSADNRGVFVGDSGSLTQIARKGQSAPDGNGSFLDFGTPAINESGKTAFRASLGGTNGGSDDDFGIYSGDGNSITQVAREGQSAPGGNGAFASFAFPEINRSGETAFLASLSGTSGGNNDNLALFVSGANGLTQLIRKGQSAPDNNGTISGFSTRPNYINDNGQIAVTAAYSGTSGGTDDNNAILRADGDGITQIVRSNQASPDGNGVFVGFNNPFFNNAGQTAFFAALRDTSGSDDETGVFTSDGVDTFQVVRDGDTISGSTVTSVSIGGLNNHGQVSYEAALADGRRIISRWTPQLHWRQGSDGSWDSQENWTLGLSPDAVHDVVIDPSESLTVTGSTSDTTVRSLVVGGGSGAATLSLREGAVLTTNLGTTVANNGTLAGNGEIAGELNVLAGGTVSAGQLTVNNTLNNQGTILVEGQETTAVFNDLIQNGVFQVLADESNSTSAMILGLFGGNGGFTGGGTVTVSGQLTPGNSPATVVYDGNLSLTSSSTTMIEIGGLDIESFDQMLISGDLSLDGDLNVSLINGYSLDQNQTYLIGDVEGELFGQFDGLSEGAKVGEFDGFSLFVTYTAGNGNDLGLFTVPEPSSTLFLLLGTATISIRRRRRLYSVNRQRGTD